MGGNVERFKPILGSEIQLNSDTRNRFLCTLLSNIILPIGLMGEINGGADLYTTNTESKLYAGSPSSTTGSYSLGKQTYGKPIIAAC